MAYRDLQWSGTGGPDWPPQHESHELNLVVE